jgi:hypothetical protein
MSTHEVCSPQRRTCAGNLCGTFGVTTGPPAQSGGHTPISCEENNPVPLLHEQFSFPLISVFSACRIHSETLS